MSKYVDKLLVVKSLRAQVKNIGDRYNVFLKTNKRLQDKNRLKQSKNQNNYSQDGG